MGMVRDINIRDVIYIALRDEKDGIMFADFNRDFDGFVVFTKGRGTFVDGNGTEYEFMRGSTVFLKKHDNYSFESESECSYITANIMIEYGDTDDLAAVPSFFQCTESQCKAIEETTQIWQSHSWDSRIRSKMGIFELYLNGMSSIASEDADINNYIKRALEFIRCNIKKNFSTEEVAKYCSISPSYLRAQFKKTVSKTINEYREDIRVSLACELLSENNMSIKEIANDLGYCDVYYFTRQFSKRRGVSPAGYRKQNVMQ